MGEDMISSLMFADNYVGISGTVGRRQQRREDAQEYNRTWGVTANVNNCALLVCNVDKTNLVEFEWKWGETEPPILDQYTYLGVAIQDKTNCSWDAHINRVMGKGKAQVGGMYMILRILASRNEDCDMYLDEHVCTKVVICRRTWEGNMKLKKMETL